MPISTLLISVIPWTIMVFANPVPRANIEPPLKYAVTYHGNGCPPNTLQTSSTFSSDPGNSVYKPSGILTTKLSSFALTTASGPRTCTLRLTVEPRKGEIHGIGNVSFNGPARQTSCESRMELEAKYWGTNWGFRMMESIHTEDQLIPSKVQSLPKPRPSNGIICRKYTQQLPGVESWGFSRSMDSRLFGLTECGGAMVIDVELDLKVATSFGGDISFGINAGGETVGADLSIDIDRRVC